MDEPIAAVKGHKLTRSTAFRLLARQHTMASRAIEGKDAPLPLSAGNEFTGSLLADFGLRRCRHKDRSSAVRRSWSARLGTTKDATKIGRKLFPVARKATVWPSAASKV